MDKKPTYEELEQRVTEQESQVTKPKVFSKPFIRAFGTSITL